MNKDFEFILFSCSFGHFLRTFILGVVGFDEAVIDEKTYINDSHGAPRASPWSSAKADKNHL